MDVGSVLTLQSDTRQSLWSEEAGVLWMCGMS